jgi:ribose 5-phosphate isomerase B
MKILIATDHAGFELKEKIKDFLVERGYDVKDFGAYKFEENDDYPDFVIPLAKEISNNSDLKGVILGGSGCRRRSCAEVLG